MKITLAILLILIAATSPLLPGQAASVRNCKKVLLMASRFPALPKEIRAWMNQRNYRVPQHYSDTIPHNVVKGRFSATSGNDWAVLCSKDGMSSIFVFLNGSTLDPIELASESVLSYCQGTGEGDYGFSRILNVGDPESLKESWKNSESSTAPPDSIDHDGIYNIFDPKGATVFYNHKGEWIAIDAGC